MSGVNCVVTHNGMHSLKIATQNHTSSSMYCTKNWVSRWGFLSKCDKIRKKLQIWSHLLKKSLTENVHFLCSDNGMSQVCFKLDFNFLNTIKINNLNPNKKPNIWEILKFCLRLFRNAWIFRCSLSNCSKAYLGNIYNEHFLVKIVS